MYEYKAFSLKLPDDAIEQKLNQYADKGWRVLQVTPYIQNKKTGGTYSIDPEQGRELLFILERTKKEL